MIFCPWPRNSSAAKQTIKSKRPRQSYSFVLSLEVLAQHQTMYLDYRIHTIKSGSSYHLVKPTMYLNITSWSDDKLTTPAFKRCVACPIWHTCPIRQAYKVPPKYRHVPLAPIKAATYSNGGELSRQRRIVFSLWAVDTDMQKRKRNANAQTMDLERATRLCSLAHDPTLQRQAGVPSLLSCNLVADTTHRTKKENDFHLSVALGPMSLVNTK